MDTGLLILRLVLGLLLAAHGSQKLFGWFGGYGIAGTGGWLASIGFRPGNVMAVITGLAELLAGLALALGLLTPLAAAAVVGTLGVAAWTHSANGLWGTNGGYEMPLLFIAGASALAFTGPGAFSIDGLLGIETVSPVVALGAIALGALSAVVVVAKAKATLAADARSASVEPDAVSA
ncbi:MAG: DoxX family protein [Microbacteriaceae bacterium]|jgi:putative oxidoreductase